MYLKQRVLTAVICWVLSGCGSSLGLTRNVTLLKDVSAPYGSTAIGTFQIDRNQDPILHDCATARIEAVIWNPPENFRIPDNEAKLDIQPTCLLCSSVAGRITERKLNGSISGENLKGEDYEELLSGGKDIFGLGLAENSGGILRIDSLEEIAPCLGYNKPQDSSATK